MANLDDVFKILTDIRVEQGVQGTELDALNKTSVDTNRKVGELEKDVAVLKDARKTAAEQETKKLAPTVEKRGNKGVWIAIIAAISAFLTAMIGCFQNILTSPNL